MTRKKSKPKETSVEEKKIDKSPKIWQRDKIKFNLDIRQRDDLTERQKLIIEAILRKDTKCVFINGPAGTSKSYLGVLCGLMLMNQKSMSDIIFVRSVIESASKSLGALPGESKDKFKPYAMPLDDKLAELLPTDQIKELQKDERIQPIPINFLRGSNFNSKYILADESQNMTFKELVTLITRVGEYSKLVVVGDTQQSDINGNSGFGEIMEVLSRDVTAAADNGIYFFTLTSVDIVRSKFVRFIIESLERYHPKH